VRAPSLEDVSQEGSGEGRRSGYPPISDYAMIGDCRTAALVSRAGSIDWLCPATFASPALFAGLLDERRGGHFALRPVDAARVRRRYLDDAPVLESSFETRPRTRDRPDAGAGAR
jgi:GH15 family glucan-1,4-alpha-glucosidase